MNMYLYGSSSVPKHSILKMSYSFLIRRYHLRLVSDWIHRIHFFHLRLALPKMKKLMFSVENISDAAKASSIEVNAKISTSKYVSSEDKVATSTIKLILSSDVGRSILLELDSTR